MMRFGMQVDGNGSYLRTGKTILEYLAGEFGVRLPSLIIPYTGAISPSSRSSTPRSTASRGTLLAEAMVPASW